MESFQAVNVTTYQIDLVADNIAPLIWIEMSSSVIGWFSDNAFTMSEPKRTIFFTEKSNSAQTITAHDVKICSLKDCGNTAA